MYQTNVVLTKQPLPDIRDESINSSAYKLIDWVTEFHPGLANSTSHCKHTADNTIPSIYGF